MNLRKALLLGVLILVALGTANFLLRGLFFLMRIVAAFALGGVIAWWLLGREPSKERGDL